MLSRKFFGFFTIMAITAPLQAAPSRSIEWSVTNVPDGDLSYMAVLLQGPTAYNPRPVDYLPYVYREYPGASLSLDFDGQVDGISFLGVLENTVSILVTRWESSTGLTVLNPDLWPGVAKTVGESQESGEGWMGGDATYVPYYLLVFNTDSTATATQWAILEWEHNPDGRDVNPVWNIPGNPNGNQYVNFDVGNLIWEPITVIPEPASLAILGLGAVALMVHRRK
ncbi:MAG: PEP-CTERM sorting domain-containing protein [Phycisphaerales bacterium]|nr:PEP-CTERM sorting domain-containing protein [Phycisphaerales bacterium]